MSFSIMDDTTTNNPLNTNLAGDNSSNDLGKQPADTPPSPTSDMPSEPAAVQEDNVAVPATTPTMDTPTEEPVGGVSDMAKPVSPPPVAGDDQQSAVEKPQVDLGGSSAEDEAKPESDSLVKQEPVSDVTSAPSGPVVKPEESSIQGEPSSSLSQEPQMPAAEPTEQSVSAPVGDVTSPSAPSEQTVSPVSEQSDTTSEQAVEPQPAVAETPGGVSTDDDLKKTHEPIVVLPDRLEVGQTVDVKVRVGMVPHVMDDAHYIQSIELFGNDKSFGKIELNPKDNPEPEATFQVPLSAGLKLKAVIYCNVHGKWESERDV